MDLTHPSEIEDETDSPKHPIATEKVEQALQMSEASLTVDQLHQYLETVQESFEHRLSQKAKLYDPLDLFGVVYHWMRPTLRDPNYPYHFHFEDGKHGFENEERRKYSLASKEVIEEHGENLDYKEYEGLWNDKKEEISLDEYTKEEQYEAFPMKFNVWENVAEMLDIDRDSETLQAIKMAHELTYEEHSGHTEYGTTGFIVGMPDMYWCGMRAEQRLFSAFVQETDLTPAELVDAYGNRVSYRDDSKWASKRAVSKSAVSQTRKSARSKLKDQLESGTFPESFTY